MPTVLSNVRFQGAKRTFGDTFNFKGPAFAREVNSNRQIARRWHLRACRFDHAGGYVTFVFDLQMCIQHDLRSCGAALVAAAWLRERAHVRNNAAWQQKKDFGRTPS
jgi:hypothetical protein